MGKLIFDKKGEGGRFYIIDCKSITLTMKRGEVWHFGKEVATVSLPPLLSHDPRKRIGLREITVKNSSCIHQDKLPRMGIPANAHNMMGFSKSIDIDKIPTVGHKHVVFCPPAAVRGKTIKIPGEYLENVLFDLDDNELIVVKIECEIGMEDWR